MIGDAVIVPSDADPAGHVYAFDVRSGDVLWKVPFAHGVATTPLRAGNQIIVVSAAGTVASIDPKNGATGWNVTPAGDLKALPYIQSPAFSAGRIFFADNTGRVFALDASDGHTVWEARLPARANTALTVIDKTLVAGTADGFLNWMAIDSGEVTQRLDTRGIPYGTPISAPPLLFVLAKGEKGRLLAIDAAKRTVRWEREIAGEWSTFRPLVTGEDVIVGDDGKELCGFQRSDGTQRWCRPVGQTPRGLGISPDGTLYIGSLSGVVQARPRSKP
jgi:outer membrane protein assembly factor BamB